LCQLRDVKGLSNPTVPHVPVGKLPPHPSALKEPTGHKMRSCCAGVAVLTAHVMKYCIRTQPCASRSAAHKTKQKKICCKHLPPILSMKFLLRLCRVHRGRSNVARGAGLKLVAEEIPSESVCSCGHM